MAEYIKRSEAMKVCQDYSLHCFTTNDASGQDIADRIENDIVEIPTADVVEAVNAEWVEWYPPKEYILTGEELLYCCSNCDAKYLDVEGYKYCPYCGAEMDGGKAE